MGALTTSAGEAARAETRAVLQLPRATDARSRESRNSRDRETR